MLCNETPRTNRGKERLLVSCVWKQKIYFPLVTATSEIYVIPPCGTSVAGGKSLGRGLSVASCLN